MSDPLSRGEFIQVSAAAGAAGSAAHGGTAAATGATAPLKVRWYGGGVYELATPDDKNIVLVDAWIWNNTGFKAFNIDKPAELSSAAAYAAHITGRAPDTFVVALSHDHGDHMGDYFELLTALVAAGVDVKTVGQSDLMRVGLLPKFKAANLDNTQLVLNGGAGINMGGTATYKGVTLHLVPAVHSTASGFPAAGFIIDIGGARVYASGDTDVYGDMALVGTRYSPDLAVLCTGNGAFTMGPDDAALTCKLLGVSQAIPVHYGHNPLVVGPQCGDLFKAAAGRVSPRTAVTLMRPGQSTTVQIVRNPAR
jgi:L-ascorbate metabolism protein UlaG (beta-lactamase superfamily)